MSHSFSNDERHQILEQLAYQAWLNRGSPHGSPEVDWDQAVSVLNMELTQVGGVQPQTDGHASFNELGNDEDTPPESNADSPFEAAQSQNLIATHSSAKNSAPERPGFSSDFDGEAASTAGSISSGSTLIGEKKKRGRRREQV